MNDLSERDFIDQQLNGNSRPLPEAAYQPLASLIEDAIPSNNSTARVYRTAFGLFLQYLEAQRSSDLPPAVQVAWCPFATARKESGRTIWLFRPPAAVLRLVDKNDFEGFTNWRADEGDSVNTLLTRVGAVKSLFHSAWEAGIVDVQEALHLGLPISRQPREPTLLPPEREPTGRWLTAAEVRLLRGVIQLHTKKGKRDLALLDSILYLGLRSDELRSLTWSDVDVADSWWITLKQDQSDEPRRLKVHPILRLSLLNWFSAVDFWQEPEDTPLFVSINKGGTLGWRVLTGEAIKQTVSDYGVLAGLTLANGSERLTPTILRRTCGRHAYTNGASLKQVQELLGHSTIDLTAGFIGAFDQDENTAVDYIDYHR